MKIIDACCFSDVLYYKTLIVGLLKARSGTFNKKAGRKRRERWNCATVKNTRALLSTLPMMPFILPLTAQAVLKNGILKLKKLLAGSVKRDS